MKVCLHPLSLTCITLQCPKFDGKYTPPTAKQLTKQYGWRVHTITELMVLLQRQGGNTDEDIFFCHAAKTRACSNIRVAMGDFMVWAQKLDQSVHQNTNGKPTSRAFDWCNKNIVSFTVK
jgi:hypothetical protein